MAYGPLFAKLATVAELSEADVAKLISLCDVVPR